MARIIAIKRGIKGRFGSQRASCESFDVDWNDQPADDFMDAWELQNPDYKALWITRFGKNL